MFLSLRSNPLACLFAFRAFLLLLPAARRAVGLAAYPLTKMSLQTACESFRLKFLLLLQAARRVVGLAALHLKR
jgi:hypothetical protein